MNVDFLHGDDWGGPRGEAKFSPDFLKFSPDEIVMSRTKKGVGELAEGICGEPDGKLPRNMHSPSLL